ncbi:hypothetical protein [Streptomyces sp. CRN 30]|uniref:hypothetical protein n=1 Tax=Streptomyces sp. CRN 30 TaxID=3075613 RepID=UPI002A81FB8C|nr:hypothetical protein [Streptomyces sp. CRN 30]
MTGSGGAAATVSATIERRMRLTERAALLRKELAEIDAELGRLEAAEVVFGQWSEATDGGRRSSGTVEPEPEPERAAAGPGAGGMRLVPDRVEGMGLGGPALGVPADHGDRGRSGRPVMAKDVTMALGRERTPGKVEPVRGRLRRLADRDWLKRTGSGRYLPR